MLHQERQLTLGWNELQPGDGNGTGGGNGLLERLLHPFGGVYKKTTNLLEHPGRETVLSKQEVTGIQSYKERHNSFFAQVIQFNNTLLRLFLHEVI